MANCMVRVIDPNGTESNVYESPDVALDMARGLAADGWQVHLYGPADASARMSRREIRAWNVPDPCPTDCGCRVPGMPLECPTTTHNRTLGVRD